MFGVYVEYTSCSGDSHDFILSSYDDEATANIVADTLNTNLTNHEGRFVVYKYEAPKHNVTIGELIEELTKPQISFEDIFKKVIADMYPNYELTKLEKPVTMNHRGEVLLKQDYDFET